MPLRRSPRWSRIEREARDRYGVLIAGIDEVGRGPLAGPVVACAIIMPHEGRAISGVDDSKRVRPEDRERLAALIRARALALGVGAASPREVDRLNIYHATTLAMRRALARLGCTPDHVIVDGRPIRTLGIEHTAVVGGDGKCYAVACASIIAKVTRDRLMRQLSVRYPGYAWERNAGYGTRAHLAALDQLGTTAHHRRSFCVRQLTLALDADVAFDDNVAHDDEATLDEEVAFDAEVAADADVAPHAEVALDGQTLNRRALGADAALASANEGVGQVGPSPAPRPPIPQPSTAGVPSA